MLNSNYKRTMEKVLFAFFFCFNRYIFLCHTRFGDVHTHTWTLSHENETRITEIKQKQTNVAFKRVVFFFCFVLVLLISFTFLFFFYSGSQLSHTHRDHLPLTLPVVWACLCMYTGWMCLCTLFVPLWCVCAYVRGLHLNRIDAIVLNGGYMYIRKKWATTDLFYERIIRI